MDLAKVLAQLRLELQNLDLAIASLERLAAQTQRGDSGAAAPKKRRGRPSKRASAAGEQIAIEKRSGTK